MTQLAVTVLALLCFVLLGEAALWGLLVRRLDPKHSLTDEDLARTGLFPMRRIRVAAVCHTVALGVSVILPLVLLW